MESSDHQYSLGNVYRSISTDKKGFWGKLFIFFGPGFLVAVGYMDPGNWATGLEGGARFQYTLLSVVLISNFIAMFLQHLALKLGVVTKKDLAQNCRAHYSKRVNFGLWVLCELAIIATDLAEVLGSAIALNLLFSIPIFWGAVITVLDVFLILYLQNKGFRYLEAFILSLIIVIFACFALEIYFAKPQVGLLLQGLVPSLEIVYNPQALYIAIGILGATVMPHNLYLHSSIVLSRKWTDDQASIKQAIKYLTIDVITALVLALFINGAIVVVAASVFYNTNYAAVIEIQEAYQLLSPLLGVPIASILFGVALLASGQNSTLTGTLAGQIVMEGFLNIRLPNWLRRLITRAMALIPVLLCLWILGDQSITEMLILSQVVLSMQLPFAVVPLVYMTGDKSKMGVFANGPVIKYCAWIIAAFIIFLNILLLWQLFYN